MELELGGRSVIVTAAGEGIGRACARALAREGCRLTLGSRSPGPLRETVALVEELGAECVSVAADLVAQTGVDALAAAARDRFGAVDGLVACVGSTPFGTFDAIDDEAWMAAFEMKFLATVRVIRAVLPDLMASRGRVVILAGNTASSPSPDNCTSGAINAALNNLAGSLARRYGPDRIGFVCVNPGPVRTRRFLALRDSVVQSDGVGEDEAEARIASSLPSRRIAEPEEVAALVAQLLSPLSRQVTGAGVVMDGGLSWLL